MPTERVAIDHGRVADGFNQLRGHSVYVEFPTFCGVCDEAITLTAKEQKYLLELKGVPVKMLLRGAAFCPTCIARRRRINFLAKGDRWRDEPNGQEQLASLRMEEQTLTLTGRHRSPGTAWPYGAD